MRCTALSATNHARTVATCGPRTGARRTGGLRGGGVASANANRTVRRCTLCLSASARIDRAPSRASRRILSNCSTLDISFNVLPLPRSPWQTTRTVRRVGREWGQIRASKPLQAGPNQTGTLRRDRSERGSPPLARGRPLSRLHGGQAKRPPLTRCESRNYALQRPRGSCRTLSRMASLQVRDSVELLAATCE